MVSKADNIGGGARDPGEVASVAFAKKADGTILFVPSLGREQQPGDSVNFPCEIVDDSDVVVSKGNFSNEIRALVTSMAENKGYIEGWQNRLREAYESVKGTA